MRNGYRAAVIAVLVIAVIAVLTLRPRATSESAYQTAATTGLPTLVDLGATRCVPCRMMAPILDELREDFAGALEVRFIDVWENPGAGEPYAMRVIPTQIFFDAEGRELFRHEGFYSREQILGKWQELGYRFSAEGNAAGDPG